MRRQVLALAAVAATVTTFGLTATAQAQTASHALPRIQEKIERDLIGAGVDTSADYLLKCGKGMVLNEITLISAKPKLPRTIVPVQTETSLRLEGDWPAKPTAYHLIISYTCKKAAAKARPAAVATLTQDGTLTVKPSPGENDIVGVGSDTTTPLLDQFSADYNDGLAASASHLWSWNAVNPITGQIGDSIQEKADCPAIVRPDGSSQGIAQLATFTKSSSGPFCTNFARSSRARASTDPPYAAGGIAFTALAGDAVSWSVPAANTSAPTDLTTAQLQAIFTCTDTNWSQVGGANEPIAAFLPQSGSGTLSFWETTLGITPGPCVSNDGNALEENEGVNPVLNNPGGIFIYSVGDYIAQTEHSAKCLNSGCKANSSGVICKPSGSENLFGCNVHGTMTLGEINGDAPISGSGTSETINTAFPFQRTLYDVVPFDPSTTDHIPGATSPVGGLNLEQVFGASGWACANASAQADIGDYGFLPLANCGATN